MNGLKSYFHLNQPLGKYLRQLQIWSLTNMLLLQSEWLLVKLCSYEVLMITRYYITSYILRVQTTYLWYKNTGRWALVFKTCMSNWYDYHIKLMLETLNVKPTSYEHEDLNRGHRPHSFHWRNWRELKMLIFGQFLSHIWNNLTYNLLRQWLETALQISFNRMGEVTSSVTELTQIKTHCWMFRAYQKSTILHSVNRNK